MSNSRGAVEDLARGRVPLQQDSANSVADDFAGDAARTLRAGSGPVEWAPQSIAGAALGLQAQWQWRAACDVREIINHIRKPAASTDQRLREVAADILQKTGPDGKGGALGALSGHLFEYCDIRDYNLRRAGVYRLVQVQSPFNPRIDAIRLDANGKFAGAIQHKLGPAGIPRAIKELQAFKPRLAKTLTFRVPADRFEDCKQAASGGTRVAPSHLTNTNIRRIAKYGLRDLAGHGEAATSLARQAGRAAARSAAVSIVVGGVVDLRAMVGGHLNYRQFAARRGVDAAQVVITTAATSTAIVGVTTGATFLARKAAAGTLAATAAGTLAASTVIAPAAAALVVGCGISWGASRVRRYATDRLHSPAVNETEAGMLREHPEDPAVINPPGRRRL